ncbi:MAG TPA: S8 family serine peptidase [Gammaproteobacteria bacterium]|nr:S8 family serine peptidase [Gammaproteobacteria bacterium]
MRAPRLVSIGLLCLTAVTQAQAQTDTAGPRLDPPPQIEAPARVPRTTAPLAPVGATSGREPALQSRSRPEAAPASEPTADESNEPAPDDATGPPTPAEPDQDTYVPQSGTATGSLLGQALPAPPHVPAYAAAPDDDEGSEPDELLILSPDLPHALQVQQFGKDLGLAVKRRSVLPGLGLVVTTFRVPRDLSPAQLVQQLRTQAPDLWIDLNHRFTLQGENDARRYPARMLAWPGTAQDCGHGMRIGLVDGPLPDRHPALEGGTITRRSFVTRGVQAAPSEHALAVATLLIGREGRGLVPAAALFHAEVMRQRDKKHVDTTVDWLVQGLDWLAQQQVDLINLSLGGPHNLILAAAVQRVLDLEIPVIAAAGNQGAAAEPLYPAAQEGVIAVTAIDAARRLYRHANRGEHIVFAAPGVDIWVPRGEGDAFVSGTSFAVPYVTALLAAHRQSQPRVPWAEHLQALIDAAEDLGEPGRDALFGYGLPRAANVCH